jgi:hypothetical protein
LEEKQRKRKKEKERRGRREERGGGDLLIVPKLVSLSRKAIKNIKQNLFLSSLRQHVGLTAVPAAYPFLRKKENRQRGNEKEGREKRGRIYSLSLKLVREKRSKKENHDTEKINRKNKTKYK